MNDRISAMSFAQGVEHYLARKQARGAAANTIRAYACDLRQFAAFVGRLDRTDIVALVSQRHVSRWLDDLTANEASPRSQARKLAVLRGFVKHARREGWLAHDPTADEQVRFRTRRVIAPEMSDLLRLVDSIDGQDPLSLRDRAVLRLAIDTGIRISEAASIDIPGASTQTSIDMRRHIIHVVGKGGDIETQPFNERTGHIIEAWLHARCDMAAHAELALFVTQQGGRPTRQTLHALFKKRAAAAGIADAHWHLMRHRRISQVVQACGIKIAQQFARHASMATTGQYGHHADSVAFALVRERADIDAMQGA